MLIATAADRLRPLTAEEDAALPAMSRCVSCGLCALAVEYGVALEISGRYKLPHERLLRTGMDMGVVFYDSAKSTDFD